ncbi:MAG: adenine-specific methyltransferase EcoRI family protein [Acidobacteriota bacterium]|nr:adenine-specific methyltransferase EcoRI family protein [Acidobacteriota bacterium]
MANKNKNLHKANKSKNDEFYTQLSDIEKEVRHYKEHFKDKVVFCNCDDPRVSNFFHYFSHSFEKLGLKKLITTCYKNQNPGLFSEHDSERAVYLEYTGDRNGNNVPDPEEIGIKELNGDGDFRSEESVELLKQADIVVTNPPFSLFREYVGQLMKYEKKFLIVGTANAITYKEIFNLIKENKIWLGYGFERGDAFFKTPFGSNYGEGVYDPNTGLVKFRNVAWFTNLEHQKRHEKLILFKPYNSEEYPTYDNYDAIEVSKTKDIPVDYDGAMGVPITFLDKYNPEQFEILGITDRDNDSELKTKIYTLEDVPKPGDLNRRAAIKIGDTYKSTYARLLIKKKEK